MKAGSTGAAGVCAELQTSPHAMHVPWPAYTRIYSVLLRKPAEQDAYRLIRQDNLFPAVCGDVSVPIQGGETMHSSGE